VRALGLLIELPLLEQDRLVKVEVRPSALLNSVSVQRLIVMYCCQPALAAQRVAGPYHTCPQRITRCRLLHQHNVAAGRFKQLRSRLLTSAHGAVNCIPSAVTVTMHSNGFSLFSYIGLLGMMPCYVCDRI
jgi:hypothetical protein